MVSPNVLICSGHAIKKPSKTVDTITVYPGRNGSSKPISATATTHYVDSKYSGTGNEYDYGIVVLNSNIGNTSGWLGLHVPSSDSGINNKSITVTGYPGDKPSGTMWNDSGTTYDVSTCTFKHNADTM